MFEQLWWLGKPGQDICSGSQPARLGFMRQQEQTLKLKRMYSLTKKHDEVAGCIQYDFTP